MKIGIDGRLWAQTGVGRYTRNLVLNLLQIDRKNEYVLFVRPHDFNDIENQISKLKIKNLKLKIIKTEIHWHSLKEQVELPKLLNKEKLDLVHFPYFSVPIFYNKPFVVTIHDLIVHHFPTGKASTLFPLLYYSKLFAYKFIIYKASKNAKKIIVPSLATKNEVMDHLKVGSEKIAVTYEAASLATSHESLTTSQKYGQYFLYVGNAYPHKNLGRLIQAFNKISKDYKDLKLILVGNKDYFYKRLEKGNKSDRIVFYGKATDKELSSLYSNAIALVVSSLMEGFGLPVLEAMVNKCLVLASDIPAFREIAGDDVLYFNPKNVDDIQDKLKDVMVNAEKYKKVKLDKAFEKSKKFSWEKMTRETLKIYESSLSL